MTELDRALESLDAAQAAAVAWEEGPLLVLAGPGSGKTRVLTTRIARLLSRETSFRVLALTFTNKAADEMRSRLEVLCPEEGHRMFAGTFHSFASDIVRHFGSHAGLSSDFGIVSEEDRRVVFREAVRKTLGEGAHDMRLLETLDFLKSRLIPPADTARRFRNPEQGLRMARLYGAYEELLASENCLDFNSLMLHACHILKQYPAIAERYQQTYRYWLIDEFQDTNGAQYALLKMLSQGTFRNVFAVADDDQILYQWNGASYQFIEGFKRDFVPELLQLPTSHRCPANVIELANKLIRHNQDRTPGKSPLAFPATADQPIVPVRTLEFDRPEDEATFVAEEIKGRHSDSLPSVVVLARNRNLLEGIRAAAAGCGIRAIVAQRRDRFVSPAFRFLHSALVMACRRMDPRELERLCHSLSLLINVELSPEDIRKTAPVSGRDLLAESIAAAVDSGQLSDDATSVLQGLLGLDANGTEYEPWTRRALEWVSNLSADEKGSKGFSDFGEDAAAWTELQREIRGQIGSGSPLSYFLQELESRSKEPPPGPDVLQLLTIHASKGKEFDYVYIIGVAEDILPSFQAKKNKNSVAMLEEERRNCFVALTRTQKQLTISYATKYKGYRKFPSRFLEEMGLAAMPAPSKKVPESATPPFRGGGL